MEILALVGACIVIMLASLSGIIFVTKRFGAWTEKNIQYLVAFSAGVFLIVSYNLIFEAFEFGSGVLVSIAVIVGFLGFYIIEKSYPELHCHHGDGVCLDQKNKKGAYKVLVGDAFHNIADGILLAPIFMIDIRLGFTAAIGIFVHEFVQEISEFFVLRSAGYTTKEALLRNFIVSATIFIGAFCGLYLSSFAFFVGPLIGLAAGAFLYILIVDLIPESVKRSHSEQKYITYLAWALTGILLILSVNILTDRQLELRGLDGHGHLESDHDDHDVHEDSDEIHEDHIEDHHDDL